MKKEEALKYIEDKGDSSFVVRTEEEETVFLANHAKKIEEEQIPSKISELHSRYDEDIFAVTGLKKNPTEKTYDFTKRVLAEYKTKAEKSSVLEKEIDSLKQQIKDGTGDKKTLADLESVQKSYEELKQTKEKELSDIKTEYDKYKIKAEITSALSGIAFKKNLPESALKALTDQVINDLSNVAEYHDGKLVFMENGVPKRNVHNALNPYTASEIVKERLKDIIDTGKQTSGGPDVSKEIVKEFDKDGKLTKVSLILPDSIKYKDELSQFLVSSGLLRGTKEYLVAYGEYSPSLKAR